MVTVAAFEEVLRIVFSFLIVIVEACGGLVIVIGVSRAIVGYVRTCGISHRSRDHTGVRITLGRSMVLALEFQVAADILKTGLSPTWEDILLLQTVDTDMLFDRLGIHNPSPFSGLASWGES